jgi:hypothetical protein
MEAGSVLAVGYLINDRSVLAKSYAWRPLALLPILKGSACAETNDDWIRHRRMELYHSSMDHIIADINELCSKNMYLRFADGQVRCSRAFYHLLVMDGHEVDAALMCDVNQCPVCTCPHSKLDWTDVSFPYRNTESVKAAVRAAQEEHLDEDGKVLDGHNTEACKAVLMYHILISYTKLYTISYVMYTISYKYNVDIVCDIVYDIYIHIRYCTDFSTQVGKLVRSFKHKLRPDNAYFKAKEFDAILSAPKEELHQLLIGLYGEHLLPATMYEIEKTLRNPNTIKGFDKNGAPIYLISKQRLKT